MSDGEVDVEWKRSGIKTQKRVRMHWIKYEYDEWFIASSGLFEWDILQVTQ